MGSCRKTINRDALTVTEFAERHLIDKLLSNLAREGYFPVSIDIDGEVKQIKDARQVWTIWTEYSGCVMFLKVRSVRDPLESWIKLVQGNGADVISDWMTNDKRVDRITTDVAFTGLT